MIIKNVKVYGEDRTFTPGEVIIEDGLFAASASNENEIIDGEGCYAIPGLIDIPVTELRKLWKKSQNTKLLSA